MKSALGDHAWSIFNKECAIVPKENIKRDSTLEEQ